MRVVVGLAKYLFLAQLVNRLGYTGFLLDGHPHSMMDLGIAVAAFYVYLYCNFSGFCDLAIGAGGLVGIAIAENFANPFAARNVREFWNQWHITLSTYMRDMVFTPLSKRIVALAGPRSVPHAIAAAIAVVFLLVGVWHGTGWNFVLFGALHALAVVGNHYYTLGLKELLGKKRFKAYVESRLVRALAVAATWCFVAGSLFFFANDRPHADRIVAALTLRSALYDPVH